MDRDRCPDRLVQPDCLVNRFELATASDLAAFLSARGALCAGYGLKDVPLADAYHPSCSFPPLHIRCSPLNAQVNQGVHVLV